MLDLRTTIRRVLSEAASNPVTDAQHVLLLSYEEAIGIADLIAQTRDGPAKGPDFQAERTVRVEPLVKSGRNPFATLITLGRATNNDLIVPLNTISKIHAIFHEEEGVWHVEDRGSRNGVCVNGKRIEQGKPFPLGDLVHISFAENVEGWFLFPDTFQGLCVDS